MTRGSTPGASTTGGSTPARPVTAIPGTVARGALRDLRRSLVGWSLAVGAVAALYTVFYPTIGETKFQAMLDAMPAVAEAMGLDVIVSAAGYVGATVYTLLGCILTLVCALALGARLVAGQEEAGTLELDLAAPVSRARVYVERLGVLWLGVLALVVSISAVVLLMDAVLGLELDRANVAAIGVGLLALAGSLGTVAFAVGAATGRRATAIGVSATAAVLAYLLSYLAPLVDAPWMDTVSPFSWYAGDDPLLTGFDWPGLGLLAALAVTAAVIGLVLFGRRDLKV